MKSRACEKFVFPFRSKSCGESRFKSASCSRWLRAISRARVGNFLTCPLLLPRPRPLSRRPIFRVPCCGFSVYRVDFPQSRMSPSVMEIRSQTWIGKFSDMLLLLFRGRRVSSWSRVPKSSETTAGTDVALFARKLIKTGENLVGNVSRDQKLEDPINFPSPFSSHSFSQADFWRLHCQL